MAKTKGGHHKEPKDLKGAQDPAMYLTQHIHLTPGAGKNVKPVVHNCPFFASKKPSAKAFDGDKMRDGKKVVMVVKPARDGTPPPPKVYDHLGNQYSVKPQKIGGKPQHVATLAKKKGVKWSDAQKP